MATCVAFNPNGFELAAGFRNGHVRIYQLSKLPQFIQPKGTEEEEMATISDGSVSAVAYSKMELPGVRLFASSHHNNGHIFIHNVSDNYSLHQKMEISHQSAPMNCLRFATFSNQTADIFLLSSSVDKTIRIFKANLTEKSMASPDFIGQFENFKQLTLPCSPHDLAIGQSLFSVVCHDRLIRLFDPNAATVEQSSVCSYSGSPTNEGTLKKCDLDPSMNLMATANSDKTVAICWRLWDTAKDRHSSDRVLAHGVGHSEQISSVKFFSQGKFASVGFDSCVFIWRNPTTENAEKKHNKDVQNEEIKRKQMQQEMLSQKMTKNGGKKPKISSRSPSSGSFSDCSSNGGKPAKEEQPSKMKQEEKAAATEDAEEEKKTIVVSQEGIKSEREKKVGKSAEQEQHRKGKSKRNKTKSGSTSQSESEQVKPEKKAPEPAIAEPKKEMVKKASVEQDKKPKDVEKEVKKEENAEEKEEGKKHKSKNTKHHHKAPIKTDAAEPVAQKTEEKRLPKEEMDKGVEVVEKTSEAKQQTAVETAAHPSSEGISKVDEGVSKDKNKMAQQGSGAGVVAVDEGVALKKQTEQHQKRKRQKSENKKAPQSKPNDESPAVGSPIASCSTASINLKKSPEKEQQQQQQQQVMLPSVRKCEQISRENTPPKTTTTTTTNPEVVDREQEAALDKVTIELQKLTQNLVEQLKPQQQQQQQQQQQEHRQMAVFRPMSPALQRLIDAIVQVRQELDNCLEHYLPG